MTPETFLRHAVVCKLSKQLGGEGGPLSMSQNKGSHLVGHVNF